MFPSSTLVGKPGNMHVKTLAGGLGEIPGDLLVDISCNAICNAICIVAVTYVLRCGTNG